VARKGRAAAYKIRHANVLLAVKEIVHGQYPDAEKITLVMDNPNRMSSLYEACAPQEARRLAEKIEVGHTPMHGSWLNMAECELRVMEKQSLDERVENEETLRERILPANYDVLMY